MLQNESIYHIYNHANGNENIFTEDRNYHFFLDKMAIYLLPVVKIYAYCLMQNHFHLAVGIRSVQEINNIFKKTDVAANFEIQNNQEQQYAFEKITSKSFSNLFSSYTQAFNKLYNRKGSLFMSNFKSNLITSDLQFCKIIHYIHANPVHHGFVKKIDGWKYSSFLSFISDKNTSLEREYVLDIFGGRRSFLQYHAQPIDLKLKWHDE